MPVRSSVPLLFRNLVKVNSAILTAEFVTVDILKICIVLPELITTLSRLSGEKNQIEKLAEETEQGENLFEKNSDMICWLDIEGTEISYPVMYTPDDPEYYLHRDFDGEYSYSGMPF